jgi:hypothetical protein
MPPAGGVSDRLARAASLRETRDSNRLDPGAQWALTENFGFTDGKEDAIAKTTDNPGALPIETFDVDDYRHHGE